MISRKSQIQGIVHDGRNPKLLSLENHNILYKYNLGTNTRNRAMARTYTKLWGCGTDLKGPMIIVDSEPPPFYMTY